MFIYVTDYRLQRKTSSSCMSSIVNFIIFKGESWAKLSVLRFYSWLFSGILLLMFGEQYSAGNWISQISIIHLIDLIDQRIMDTHFVLFNIYYINIYIYFYNYMEIFFLQFTFACFILWFSNKQLKFLSFLVKNPS